MRPSGGRPWKSPPPDPAPSISRGPSYDPEFRPAVDAGHLTPAQALQRGDRALYADTIAKRHDLPLEVALRVTDNSVSLAEALREREAAAVAQVEARESTRDASPPRWGAAAWLLAAAVGVGVLLAGFRSNPPSGSTPTGSARLTSILGADVLTDEWGRALKVSAADPQSVLAAFCAADPDRGLAPLDVVTVEGNDPGRRLGLLRRSHGNDEVLAIPLREESESTWVAGDGFAPIAPRPAPPGVAATTRR